MMGDENGIEMVGNGGNDRICFDIIVKTAKGALYCGYFARND